VARNCVSGVFPLDTADRQEDEMAEMRISRLSERLEALRRRMHELQAMERAVADAPDRQVSLTDPDARAMATNGKAPAWLATTCRRQWTPSTIWSLLMRSRTSVMTGPSWRIWPVRRRK
jgi:hypothetical protein